MPIKRDADCLNSAQDAQDAQDNIRNTMSLANVLSKPSAVDRDVTPMPPLLAPPTTPIKADLPVKGEEELVAPDEIMREVVDVAPEGADESSESEDMDSAVREFLCMNDEFSRCKTGQYTKDLARKVISDHFGRNKACTRDILDWPLFCRKHYQRATYHKEKWQKRKVQLILRQFNVIDAQFPGTTYDIHFKKSEETRLNQYSRQVAAGTPKQLAEENVSPVSGKHFEAPIDVLRELDQWLGRSKTYNEVKKVVDIIDQMLDANETEQVPSIEFLPQLPGKVSRQKSTAQRRATKSPKTPKTRKTPKSPKTPSRVSTKGSVKKTNKKA